MHLKCGFLSIKGCIHVLGFLINEVFFIRKLDGNKIIVQSVINIRELYYLKMWIHP